MTIAEYAERASEGRPPAPLASVGGGEESA
jgi:hypothetical protein